MTINFNLNRNINNSYLSSCQSDLDIAVENGNCDQVTSVINSVAYKNVSLNDLESILQKALDNSKLDIVNIILNSNRAEELVNLSLSYLINNKEENIVKTIVQSQAFHCIDKDDLLSNIEKIPLLQIVLDTPKVFEILEEGLIKAAESNNIEILNAFLLSSEVEEIFAHTVETPLKIAKSKNNVEFINSLLTHKKCILEIDDAKNYLKYLITYCAHKGKEDILNSLFFISKKFHKKIPSEIIKKTLNQTLNEKIKKILWLEYNLHTPDNILKENLEDPLNYLKSFPPSEDISIAMYLLNCKNCIKDIKDIAELLIYFSKNQNIKMIELLLNCDRSKEFSTSDIIDSLKACNNKKIKENILKKISKETMDCMFKEIFDNKDTENIALLIDILKNISFKQFNKAIEIGINNNNLVFVNEIMKFKNDNTVTLKNLEMAVNLTIESKDESILLCLLSPNCKITDEFLERIINKGADCNNMEIIELLLINISNNLRPTDFLDKALEIAVKKDLSYIVNLILTNEKLKNLVSKRQLIESANTSNNCLILEKIVDSCPPFFLKKILNNALEKNNKELLKRILKCNKLEQLPSDKIDKAAQAVTE